MNNTPLMTASSNGKLEEVKTLLRLRRQHRCIDLNAQNNDGDTPLMLAISNGHFKVAKFLLSLEEIKPNKQNNNGDTALIITVSKRVSEEDDEKKWSNWVKVMVMLVNNRKTNLDMQNKNGYTALMQAALLGDEESTSILVNSGGVDLDITRGAGFPQESALSIAQSNGNGANYKGHVAQVLVDHGAYDPQEEEIPDDEYQDEDW